MSLAGAILFILVGLVTLSAYSHPGSYYWTPSYTYVSSSWWGWSPCPPTHIQVAIIGHPHIHMYLPPGGAGHPVRLLTSR